MLFAYFTRILKAKIAKEKGGRVICRLFVFILLPERCIAPSFLF